MDHTKNEQLDRMFNLRGLAFFGGITSPGAFGNLIALSQIRYGYKGSLYPISPKRGEIAGHKIYKSLDKVEGPVDLASQWGLDLPRFSNRTRGNLRQYFPTPCNSMANPLDTGSPVVPVETMQASIKEIALNEPIDVVVVILLLRPLELEVRTFMEMAGMGAPLPGAYLEQLLDVLTEIKQETGKDIAVVMENRAGRQEELDVEETHRRMRDNYQAQGFPVFHKDTKGTKNGN